MIYLFTFLEGILSFLSPCLLPLIPMYVSYFSGNNSKDRKSLLWNCLAFVVGFSCIFISLGVFSNFLGSLFNSHLQIIRILSGSIILFIGLNYLGVMPFMDRISFGNSSYAYKSGGGLSAFVFGCIFALSYSPCVSAFLANSLILAANSSSLAQGFFLLFLYSLGLAVPFVLSALFLDSLKAEFAWIRQNYAMIRKISGGLMILSGIWMMSGRM